MTKVADARTGKEVDLALLLTELEEQSRTGTLKLSSRDGQVKYLYVKKGTIELLKTNRSRTLLGKALLKRRKLTDDQLRAALERQRAAPTKLRLGEILVGMGIVLEKDVHQALALQIAEEIFELFNWGQAKSEFYRGEPPLDIFESEDLQARVALSPVQLTREAIRRQNELVEIKRALPSVRDVFALTPQAYAKAEAEQNPVVQEVVSTVDGQKSLSEIVDASRAPDLAVMRVILKLVTEQDAIALSAQDLIALGQELEDRAEYERARERYLRAEELGHPDFDLPRRIGQIAEALGDKVEACRRYVIYADRCAQAGYPDVATATLERALALEPANVEARERQAELLARAARTLLEANDPAGQEKAAEAAAHYERLLATTTAPAEQKRILTALTGLAPGRADLRERMAEVSIALGDPGQAVQELQELAIEALEANDRDRAITLLTRIVEIDPDDLLGRQSLAATYAGMGRTQDAVREYLRLVKTLETSGLAVASADRMVELYEKVIELDPTNAQAQQFLAHAYDDKKENDKAAANYARMVEALRAKGDDQELLAALDKLVALKPGDQALTLERARLLKKLGRGGEAVDALRALAEAATKQGDAAAAQSAWTEVLAQVPGDLDAHLAVARLEEKDKQLAQASRRLVAVFEMALVVGKDALAEDAVKRLLDIEPDPAPEHRERLARILVLRGRKDEAARALVRSARRARDDENTGLAKSFAQRALELDGTCDDARDLLEALKRPPPAAVPVQTAPPVAEAPREKIQATISGGSSSGGSNSAMPSSISIEGRTPDLSRKASSAMNRLRQLKGGGGPPTPPGEAPAVAPPSQLSKGPEAPGEAVDQGLSKKAAGAMNKLKALKSGGGGGASSSPSDAAPIPTTPTQPISKGPEAPGEPVDEGLSKKASGAMSKLKALKSGGGSPPSDAAPALPSQPISKGPEAPGEPVDEGLSKKASGAMNKLKALKSGGGSPPSDAAAPAMPSQPISKGPEAPGEPVDAGLSKKASGAMNKLKALKSGGGSPPSDAAAPALPTQPISKGPEAPGEAVDEGLAKKASSAMDRLKALKQGGGAAAASPAPAPTQPLSKGPEAPGEAVDDSLAKKASSAMDRLKALKQGGGAAAPAPATPSQPISKGPEAPGEAVDAGLSRKAGSAMNKLKALKSGGGGAAPAGGEPPAAMPTQPISKGPEAPGEAVDQGLARKASSAMSRLKALKQGGGGAPPSSGDPPPPSDDGSSSGETVSTVA